MLIGRSESGSMSTGFRIVDGSNFRTCQVLASTGTRWTGVRGTWITNANEATNGVQFHGAPRLPESRRGHDVPPNQRPAPRVASSCFRSPKSGITRPSSCQKSGPWCGSLRWASS